MDYWKKSFKAFISKKAILFKKKQHLSHAWAYLTSELAREQLVTIVTKLVLKKSK